MAKEKTMDPWIQQTDDDHGGMGHKYSIPADPRASKDQKIGTRMDGGATMKKGTGPGKRSTLS